MNLWYSTRHKLGVDTLQKWLNYVIIVLLSCFGNHSYFLLVFSAQIIMLVKILNRVSIVFYIEKSALILSRTINIGLVNWHTDNLKFLKRFYCSLDVTVIKTTLCLHPTDYLYKLKICSTDLVLVIITILIFTRHNSLN